MRESVKKTLLVIGAIIGGMVVCATIISMVIEKEGWSRTMWQLENIGYNFITGATMAIIFGGFKLMKKKFVDYLDLEGKDTPVLGEEEVIVSLRYKQMSRQEVIQFLQNWGLEENEIKEKMNLFEGDIY